MGLGLGIGLNDIAMRGGAATFSNRPFQMLVKTDNAGTSNNDQFTIPTNRSYTYNYDVDWGDGNTDTGLTGDETHTYSSAGEYVVKITGTFPSIYFSNGGDKDKLIEIQNWGEGSWSSFQTAFRGCSNLDITATDIPDLSSVTNFARVFEGCGSLVFNSSIGNWDVSNGSIFQGAFIGCSLFNQDITAWDTSSATNMKFMFLTTSSFNQDIGGWNVSNVTIMQQMFDRATPFDQDLGGWDFSSVTNLLDFLNSVTLSTANYDSLLNALRTTLVTTGLSFDGGNSTYTANQIDSGTTDGTTANKLVDSSQNFLTTVSVGDAVHNTTDGTWTTVTAVDSDGQLTLNSDIIVSGETYEIFDSQGAIDRARLIDEFNMTITDGGQAP